jgi:hypothetical protein
MAATTSPALERPSSAMTYRTNHLPLPDRRGGAQLALLFAVLVAGAVAQTQPRVTRFIDQSSLEIAVDGQKATLHVGEHAGDWTLMQIVEATADRVGKYAVMEDFAHLDGRMIFVGMSGIKLDLPKRSERTDEDPAQLYLGHTLDQVRNSATDLLGDEILSRPGDPVYSDIAAVFPPIRKMNTYSFVGSPDTMDKVGFLYGGRSPNFDPAPYYPPLAAIRDKGQVRDGLVGGYLPILRFVYPESDADWTEMLAFAPLRSSNGNNRVQPVWYRVARIENHLLKWAQCIDSYHPFPPRTHYDAKIFYQDILRLNSGWNQRMRGSMKIEVPDERVGNMARFALVREMMTRQQDFPKYGAVDKDYAGSEHDGFPDTFTVDTTAMLEWGLVDLAGRYIDNYFGEFVRDDGSILYRGPETGQYGRMLTVAAQYVDYGGDPAVLLRRRSRLDGITKLLLNLRTQSKTLPRTDPAYGMIAGWSEADASLDPDPPRYMQPYFSNSSEAARGFRDLGKVWEKLGRQRKDSELTAWGRTLQRESEELQSDIQTSISRSRLTVDGETILPAIAGVKQPFHVAVPLDQTDPQYRSYRAYMEMMESGNLTADEVKMIVDYRSRHHDMILGIPTAYGFNTGIMAGFLSYGHGYGLIQHDMIREALLLMYSHMAHQYTRGTWTAPETRSILPDQGVAPYCTPAQLVVALMTKWLLVFEDPQSETVWLGKALPQAWLEDGKTVTVESAPTRWGRLGFTVSSHLASGTIAATVTLPQSFPATTKLRVRAPNHAQLKSVALNGKPWDHFDAQTETITIPPQRLDRLSIVAHY